MPKEINASTLTALRSQLIALSPQEIQDIVAQGLVLTISKGISIEMTAELASEDQLTLHVKEPNSMDVPLETMAQFANATLVGYLPSGIAFLVSVPLTTLEITSGLSEESNIALAFTSQLNDETWYIALGVSLKQLTVGLNATYTWRNESLIGSFSGFINGETTVDNADFKAIIHLRGPNAWELDIIPNDGNVLPSLEQVAYYIGNAPLVSTVQKGLDALGLQEISIDGVKIGLDLTAQKVRYASMRSHITIVGVRMNLYTQLPNFQFGGTLAPESTISFKDLIQYYFGDATDFPDIVITELSFTAYPSAGMYTISVVLEENWSLTLGDNQSIALQSVALDLEKTQEDIVGSISASAQVKLSQESDIGVSVLAQRKGEGKGWLFSGQQTTGKIAVADLLKEYLGWETDLKIDIDSLGVSVETITNNWEFTGRVSGSWDTPVGDKFDTIVTAMLGYSDGNPASSLQTPNTAIKGSYGDISADLSWYGVDMAVFYNFDPTYKAYGIIVKELGLTGKIEDTKMPDGTTHQIATLAFTESTTIGSMVETMVSWATGSKFSLGAPWNVLDKIPLNGLSLVYDFTAKKVSFDVAIGPIPLGFATIKSISVSYNSNQPNPDDNGVIVNLEGSFLWQSDPSKPLAWDAAKPETTPAPSGQGNKYLDLRLLALGQHVTVDGLTTVNTVQEAIEKMETLPADTESDQLPNVKLDPNSSWLIGMDFGVLKIETKKDDNGKAADPTDEGNYVLNLQTVFNDPNLYALRIALAGDAAKVFKGLDFQIMYRKISDSVGVYQAEIKLPDKMRQINMGQFKIVLPVFGIEIYTNGDFQVDLGFPWNEDFSRSFTLYTFIYVPVPIPVMGSVGLYFGKLSSATTDKVPAATNGTFNPVLVFGIGVQFGIGYDFSIGILSAGFSLTAVAILEGVLAKWNPYQLTDGTTDANQLETSYYFAFDGTIGVIGKLYGTIDFAIIKASVNIDIRVLAKISFAPYTPIEISITASVEASLSVKINLGLFKITIHLSFSVKVQESVKLPAPGGTPPWQVGTTTQSTQLALRRRQKRAFLARRPLRWKSRRTAPIGVQPVLKTAYNRS